jgi:AraC family transcriptional regulator of adaptative response/methylated-DNA-[protein]-cysteine methyltransferase
MQLEQELSEYFDGRRRCFDVPVVLHGTNFQKRAWQALMDIPYGSTISYMQQAAAIGMPDAVRSVASANASNKISILIPCHRVINASGALCGYGGGIKNKKYLIEMEAKYLKNQ